MSRGRAYLPKCLRPDTRAIDTTEALQCSSDRRTLRIERCGRTFSNKVAPRRERSRISSGILVVRTGNAKQGEYISMRCRRDII